MTAKRTWFLHALVVTLAGYDIGTKLAARRWLVRNPISVGNVLHLRYTENHDSVFGLKLSDRPAIVTALDVCGVAVLLYVWWRRRRAPLLEQIVFAMLVAASLGNVGDRVMRGYVVDFIHVSPWPFWWNIADALIVIAVAMILVSPHPRPAQST